jgi:hypothetical protein
VVAVDGGFRETFIREDYPSASLTFFTFGPLLLRLADVRDLDCQDFIAPEDLARLKRIDRYSLALPTQGVALAGEPSLSRSFRKSLHDFLERTRPEEPSLGDALRWLIFRTWKPSGRATVWTIPSCPNNCETAPAIELTSSSPQVSECPACKGPVYTADVLRLHERVDDEQGAGAVTTYVMTTLEHLAIAQVVMTALRVRPDLLDEILFIKDGPLAFFGVTAPLRKPMVELCADLDGAGGRPKLNMVGIEKSGAFVDHALKIEKQIDPGSALLLGDAYIYKYIIPGTGAEEYGFNTYFGRKLIYKTEHGNLLVCTIPVRRDWNRPNDVIAEVAETLRVLGKLHCAMYENALLPVVLANKLVSLSDYPSSRILTAFAKQAVGGS